jgi:hypothetical protein
VGHERGLREVVTDKDYHSASGLVKLAAAGVRSYIPEEKQQRNWAGKADEKRIYLANQRRVTGDRGKRLLQRRGEFLERPFAHQYETGGMRRLHVRGLENVAKRVLLQAAAFNLALILRSLTKAGTPRGLAERNLAMLRLLLRFLAALERYEGDPGLESRPTSAEQPFIARSRSLRGSRHNVGSSKNQGF